MFVTDLFSPNDFDHAGIVLYWPVEMHAIEGEVERGFGPICPLLRSAECCLKPFAAKCAFRCQMPFALQIFSAKTLTVLGKC